MPDKTYKRAGLIGVGLMGSSVALGLHKLGIVETWVGMDRDPAVIQDALRVGAIQEVTTHLEELVKKVEWLLISIPVKGTAALAERIVPLIDNPNYFAMDVGSTKRAIVEAFDNAFLKYDKPNRFVACHPIAGKEKTGPLVSDPDLFHGKTVYLAPSVRTDPRLIQIAESLWKSLGAEPRKIDPATHDEILSVSSHLPHMVAYALMDTVQSAYEEKQIGHSLAGGLKDMTRVVSSSAEMWAEICSENSENITKQINIFQKSLQQLHELIKNRDLHSLQEFFGAKKVFRDLLG